MHYSKDLTHVIFRRSLCSSINKIVYALFPGLQTGFSELLVRGTKGMPALPRPKATSRVRAMSSKLLLHTSKRSLHRLRAKNWRPHDLCTERERPTTQG